MAYLLRYGLVQLQLSTYTVELVAHGLAQLRLTHGHTAKYT